MSFITTAQQNVIDRILEHIGESPEQPWSTGPPKWYALQQAQQHVEANPHVVTNTLGSTPMMRATTRTRHGRQVIGTMPESTVR